MNDRFKFRVWDIEDCTYFEPRDFDDIWLNENAELRVGFYSDATQMIEDYTDQVIIEQCTGLSDKNGKLIYEGDVVKQTQYDFDPAKRRVVTGIIKWHPGHAQFVFEYPDSTDGHNISEIGWGIIEIIGNIHEQPE